MENIAFIDIFTTQNDLYGKNNSPIQFALEIFKGDEVFDEEKFIKNKCERQKVINIVPDEHIMPLGTVISGFRDEDVSSPLYNWKSQKDALNAIYKVLSTLKEKDVFICGFNHVAYDLTILNSAFKRVLNLKPLEFDKDRLIDILKIMENTVEVSEIGSYSMDSVFEYLFKDVDSLMNIRAVKSTLTDIKLTKMMLHRLMNKGESFSEFLKRTSPRDDMKTLNFGKYKGAKIEDIIKIDQQYISWILNNKTFKEQNPNLIESINRIVSKKS